MDIYWIWKGSVVNTLTLPGYVKNTDLPFILTLFNNGNPIAGCYIYVPVEYAGRLSVKRDSYPCFLAVGGPFDPLTYIDILPTGPTELSFIYNHTNEILNESSVIPIYVAQTLGTVSSLGWNFQRPRGAMATCYQKQRLTRSYYINTDEECELVGEAPGVFRNSLTKKLWRDSLEDSLWRDTLE